jgi:EmrB/QacA subfamily drug resistance transporter
MSLPVSPSRRRWLGLALIATAQFVVIMDTSIIGVALPRIQADLGFTPESLSWVFNAYVVAFGGLLLLGGRLSDVFGARRLFVLGWAILIAGSLIAGLAGNPAVEIIGRAAQGAGAALIAPAALSLLMVVFGGTPELPKAFAIYGAAAPIGGTVGVFLGGVLTEWASWPWVFYVTIPIAVVVIALTRTALPAVPRSGGSVGILGATLATTGLAAIVYAVVQAPEVGWLTPTVVVGLGGGAALVAAFFVLQARSQRPLLRLGLLRARNLGASNLAQLLLGAAWVPMWFFLNLYVQEVLGAGAFAAGAALLPMTALIVIGMTLLAPRLQAKFGPKPLMAGGLLVLAAGLSWLALAGPNGTYLVDVLPATIVIALGMALAFVPSLGSAISAAPQEETGVAAGLVNTSYQIGSAFGLAALAAVAAAATGDQTSTAALNAGYSVAFVGAAVIAAVGAVAVLALFRRDRASGATVSSTESAEAVGV